MSSVRRHTVVPCLLAVGLFATGCDKLTQALEDKAEEVVGEVATPEGGAGPGGGGATEDEKLGQKLDLYIQCTNRASRRMYDSWHKYSERAKEDGTPAKKNRVPFLYKIDSELTPCEEAVAKGPGTEPTLPEVEKAMADYLTHAKVFASYTVELDKYYEQENYKDDDWAKGKEIAPKFKAAFEAWSKADGILGEMVATKKDVVELNMLALVEERYGKKIEWHSRNSVHAAKAFVRCVTAEGAKAEGCEKVFTELEEAEHGFRGFYDGNKTESDKVFWMSSFQRSIGDYYAESKKFMRDFRKGDIKPDRVNKVVDEYNDLINDSNNLRYTR
ncbi:MAG: YiiG family protein [Deltaproteobacteria bacterium]|nr:YiiG family protein [Deltaproteobacteria bacterium]